MVIDVINRCRVYSLMLPALSQRVPDEMRWLFLVAARMFLQDLTDTGKSD